MNTNKLQELLDLFGKSCSVEFPHWPNKYSNTLNELSTLKLANVSFAFGKIRVKIGEAQKAVIKMAVDEKAQAIILFNNETDWNCQEAINDKHDWELKMVKREFYVLKKNRKYKPIFFHKDDKTSFFPVNFYANNICIIGYKPHPCYPQDTTFGIKFLVGKKVCFLTTENNMLSKNLRELTKLTKPGYTYFHIYWDDIKSSIDGTIYQQFAGWEETWIEAPKMMRYNSHVVYHQQLTRSSDCFEVGIRSRLKPCAVYEFYLEKKDWKGEISYEHIGFAYDSKEKINPYPLKNPFVWSQYKKYVDPTEDDYVGD